MLIALTKGMGICKCCWSETYSYDDAGNVRCTECGTVKIPVEEREDKAVYGHGYNGSQYGYNPRTRGKKAVKKTQLARVVRLPKDESEEEEEDADYFPRDLDSYNGGTEGCSLTSFPTSCEPPFVGNRTNTYHSPRRIIDHLREQIEGNLGLA